MAIVRNSFTDQGDTIRIALKSRAEGIVYATINAEDLPSVRRAERWRILDGGIHLYASGNFGPNEKAQLLHHLILPLPRGAREHEFLNGDTLDCRRENLRIVLPEVRTTLKACRRVHANLSWISNCASILEVVKRLKHDTLNTSGLMSLLDIRRDAACHAMRILGGYQIGRSWLIGREQLQDALQAIRESGDYQNILQRTERVQGEIRGAAAYLTTRRIRLDPPAPEKIQQLSPNVTLSDTELRIRFSDSQELLEELVSLAQRWLSGNAEELASLPRRCHDPAGIITT